MRKFITHSEWLLFFEAINGSKMKLEIKPCYKWHMYMALG